MMAQSSRPAAWMLARQRRAIAGKAPRLAVQRSILMRQTPRGDWCVGIFECRFGKWKEPDWLTSLVSIDVARRATVEAWERYRLPVGWSYATDQHTRPYRFGIYEPVERVA